MFKNFLSLRSQHSLQCNFKGFNQSKGGFYPPHLGDFVPCAPSSTGENVPSLLQP